MPCHGSGLQTWYGGKYMQTENDSFGEESILLPKYVLSLGSEINGKERSLDRSGSIRINMKLKLLSLFVVFDWDGELQSGKVPRRKRPVVWKK